MTDKNALLALLAEVLPPRPLNLDDGNSPSFVVTPVHAEQMHIRFNMLAESLAQAPAEVDSRPAADSEAVVGWLGFNPRSGDPSFSVHKPVRSVVHDFGMRPVIYGDTRPPAAATVNPDLCPDCKTWPVDGDVCNHCGKRKPFAAVPTPPAVDEAMVERALEAACKSQGDEWPWKGASAADLDRDRASMRAALTAALAKQAAHQADDGEGRHG